MRRFLFHPALFTLLLFGCGKDRDERIEHIHRVFMHDTYEFSFLIRDPGTNHHTFRKVAASTVRLVYDVPITQPIWADYHDSGGNGAGCNDRGQDDVLIIHMRANAEIDGANWDRSPDNQGRVQHLE